MRNSILALGLVAAFVGCSKPKPPVQGTFEILHSGVTRFHDQFGTPEQASMWVVVNDDGTVPSTMSVRLDGHNRYVCTGTATRSDSEGKTTFIFPSTTCTGARDDWSPWTAPCRPQIQVANFEYDPSARTLRSTLPIDVALTGEVDCNNVARITGKPNICVLGLDPSEPGTVSLMNNASVTGQDCAVFSNSSHTSGLKAKNSSRLTANLICSRGGRRRAHRRRGSSATSSDRRAATT